MFIKVLFDSMSVESINDIIKYYNEQKEINEEPLEILDRCEGGFQIKIFYTSIIKENEKIKQVRWSNKCLKTPMFYHEFTYKETMLLCKAIKNVMGKDNVQLNLN